MKSQGLPWLFCCFALAFLLLALAFLLTGPLRALRAVLLGPVLQQRDVASEVRGRPFLSVANFIGRCLLGEFF